MYYLSYVISSDDALLFFVFVFFLQPSYIDKTYTGGGTLFETITSHGLYSCTTSSTLSLTYFIIYISIQHFWELVMLQKTVQRLALQTRGGGDKTQKLVGGRRLLTENGASSHKEN